MKRIFHAMYEIHLGFNPGERVFMLYEDDSSYFLQREAAATAALLAHFPILEDLDVDTTRIRWDPDYSVLFAEFRATGYFVGDWDPAAYENSLITGDGPPVLDYAKENWENIVQDVDLSAVVRALPEAAIHPIWIALEVFEDMAVPANWRVAMRLIGNKHGTLVADEEVL